MRTSLLQWLSLRVRGLCIGFFALSAILPPFVPRSALSADESAVPTPQFLFVEDGFLMKTSTIGDQGSRLAFGQVIVHNVKNGENMEAIAKRYKISADTIRSVNGIAPGAPIQPGQELLILPVDGTLHVVRKGQTLARIAQLYDISQDLISRQNALKGGFIVAGQQLVIPGGKPIGGSVPAVAVMQEGELTFTTKLPDKDIQLQLKDGKPVARMPSDTGGGPGPTKAAPSVTVQATPGIFQMPCNNCFITQYYRSGHYALDIQTRGGGPIFAAEAGTVIRADSGGWNGGYGNVIEVDHGNGLVSLYAHNKELYVKVGDSVERGQTIAWMGNTGLVYGATGIHVHFEVHSNGVKKNPLLYLE